MMDAARKEMKDNSTPDKSLEYKMDTSVGYILIIGVLASIALIAAGIVWHFIDTRKIGLDYSIRGMNLYQFVVNRSAISSCYIPDRVCS